MVEKIPIGADNAGFALKERMGVLGCVNRETFACLALSLIPVLGRKNIHWLIENFGTASRVLTVSTGVFCRRAISRAVRFSKYRRRMVDL